MFRAYGVNGPPVTSATTAANINSTASQSTHHQLGSGKDTSSLFFNQIENNLRSWHSTNYSLYPSPQPPPPPVPASTPRGLDHGIVGSGFADSQRRHHVEKAARSVSLDQLTQQQNQLPGHQDYDNVLRRMMSTASIGLRKPSSRTLASNQTRLNGNLFNKLYSRLYFFIPWLPGQEMMGSLQSASLCARLVGRSCFITGVVNFSGQVVCNCCTLKLLQKWGSFKLNICCRLQGRTWRNLRGGVGRDFGINHGMIVASHSYSM